MKIEFTHDIIAQKVWERLPEEERQLKLVAGSLKQRLEDFHKGNGSLLGVKELVAWERYFPILAQEGPLKNFIEDSYEEVQAQEEKEKLINQRLRSRLRLIYIIAGGMLLLAVFFIRQTIVISNQKYEIEKEALKASKLRLAFGADDRSYFIQEGIKKFRNADFQESIYDFAIAQFLNAGEDTSLVSSWINRSQRGMEAQTLFWAGKWTEVDQIIEDISDKTDEPLALKNQLADALKIWEPYLTEEDKASIQEIDLSATNLYAIPEEIGQFVNLKELYLTNNYLKLLPESIGLLTKLEVLGLSENIFGFLPSSLGQLEALEVLYLSDNKINSLPSTIGQLQNLKILEIDNNQMDSLPVGVNQLTALTRLLASNNHLDSLPDGFGALPEMTKMDLDSNELKVLPEGFGNMPRLVELLISNNQLSSLPASCNQLIGLTELRLENNQLTSFPESLGALQNLESIFLQNNQISEVPEAFLDNLPSGLFFLGIKGNPVSENRIREIRQKLPGVSVE